MTWWGWLLLGFWIGFALTAWAIARHAGAADRRMDRELLDVEKARDLAEKYP